MRISVMASDQSIVKIGTMLVINVAIIENAFWNDEFDFSGLLDFGNIFKYGSAEWDNVSSPQLTPSVCTYLN